jgi:hypothetical protein
MDIKSKFLVNFIALYGMALIGILLCMLVSTPVRADVGVRPVLPGGGSIKPVEETPIQMVAEVVVMNVRSATDADNAVIKLNPQVYGLETSSVWFTAIAEVEADFTMKNPTSDALSMTVWFPLASTLENVSWELNPEEIVPRIESFQVTVDGNLLDYTVNELPNPKGVDKPLLPWASFPVTFPAIKETIIHVSYLLPLQPSVKGSELALYYVFQTGAGWAGPIGQAELILNLPYPASPETLAGTSSGSLNLPYGMPEVLPGISSGGVLAGNQARWGWKDFEPGPEDDFAVWLIDPGKWQKLATARSMVQANPKDGHAWLDLASIYRSLSIRGYNTPSIFSSSYLPLGLEAYQKAADMLPEHPAPHAGLALLTLAPYMTDKNAPAEVIQSVQKELNTARELEARYPSLAEEAGVPSWMVEDVLNIYFYNNTTATAEWATWSTDWAKETADAALLLIPSSTPIPELSATMMPIPSLTPQPLPTILPTSTPAQMTDNRQSLVIIVAAGLIGLILVGFLLLNRMRGGARK